MNDVVCVQLITTDATGPAPWRAASSWLNNPLKHVMDFFNQKVLVLHKMGQFRIIRVMVEPHIRNRMDTQATAGVDLTMPQVKALAWLLSALKNLSSDYELEFYSTVTKPHEDSAYWNSANAGGYCFLTPESVLGEELNDLFDLVKPDRFIIDDGMSRKSPLTGLDNGLLLMRWMDWLAAKGIDVGIEAMAMSRAKQVTVPTGTLTIYVPCLDRIGDRENGQNTDFFSLNQHVIHYSARKFLDDARAHGEGDKWAAVRPRAEDICIWFDGPFTNESVSYMKKLREDYGPGSSVAARIKMPMDALAEICLHPVV